MVFIVNATSERSNSESQGDVIPETPKVVAACLIVTMGTNENPRHCLFLGTY